MRYPYYIASRYLFGKKSTNAINFITGLSVAGIAMGTAALILIMSVFNGFEGMMSASLDTFNPDCKILPAEGKFFNRSDLSLAEIKGIDGVLSISQVIEEVAIFEYASKLQVGIVKGVDSLYLTTTGIQDAIVNGMIRINQSDGQTYTTVGKGIYSNLNISLKTDFESLKIYLPNRRKGGLNSKDFVSRPSRVSGVFAVENERDQQYVITDYRLVASMLAMRDKLSSLEIRVDPDNYDKVVDHITDVVGPDFLVLDRYAQDASTLKIMNIEKWSAFLIFTFTLLLITFNVVGCLWMIVLDKKKDISVMQSFGATKAMIKKIFLLEGWLISIIGFGIGLLVSIVFYILQKTIGIITIPDGYNISAYPMEMELGDITIVMITVFTLGIVASIPAAMRAGQVSAYVRTE